MPNRTQRFSIGLIGLLLLVVMAACGAPESGGTEVAQAPTPRPTFTATELPTVTPSPSASATSTASPLPTSTPEPTDTATPTPTPMHTPTEIPPTETASATPTATSTTIPSTATPTAIPASLTPTPAPPVATPQPPPPTATPAASDGFAFDITMQRMLSLDENGGVVGNHNIYVHAFDRQGNPLNGVVVCRVYALQLQPPDPHACGITGETGPGRLHFDVYAGDIVYVASVDPEHRPLSPYSRPLEQEPAAMTDLQELVDNGYCDSIEDCQRRIPINNLVRFHYSYEVHFKRR